MSMRKSSPVGGRQSRLYAVLRPVVADLGMLAGRSLFPLLTVMVIAGTVLWGPWVTMVVAIVVFSAASLLC